LSKTDKPSFCRDACLTAFGDNETVTVVDMKANERRPLTIIKRPYVCDDRAIPMCSWGYGLTPADRNQSKPLLAIAWDKVIKLMTVNE